MEWSPELGARVREVRETRGWSREKLAQLSGVSPATIERMEKGAEKVLPISWRPVVRALRDETLAAETGVELGEERLRRELSDEELVDIAERHILPAVLRMVEEMKRAMDG